jgi:hypothetical protein
MADEDLDTGIEAPEAAPVEAAIKSTALEQMSKAEDITAYVAERADQELEAEGKPPATAPAERVNRYQEALEQARQETDRARSENGLGRDGFDAQIEQAALAQEQERAYEQEMSKREKSAADTALYTHKANQELDLHPGYWEAVRATFTANPPTPELAEQILAAEHGPEIVWRMTQHPDAISELNAMSPKEAERIIAKLDGAIMAERHAARQFAAGAAPRRISSAPPPMRTPTGGTNPPARSLHELAARSESVNDYIKARKAQEKRRDE